MAQVPTREEIYAEVDRLFRQDFPDAPARLSNRREDEWYRDTWLAIRDKVLYSLTDHVFYEHAPDAPYPLDPNSDSDDDKRYVREWIEIRDRIMDNAPFPPVGDVDDLIDMSDVRQGIEQSLKDVLEETSADLHDEIRSVAATAPDKIYDAFLMGDLAYGGTWRSDPVPLVGPEGAWRLYVEAWWDSTQDYALLGRLKLYE
jgi:hypothetical protein